MRLYTFCTTRSARTLRVLDADPQSVTTDTSQPSRQCNSRDLQSTVLDYFRVVNCFFGLSSCPTVNTLWRRYKYESRLDILNLRRSSRNVSVLTTIGMISQISVESHTLNFTKTCTVGCVREDRHDEANSRFSQQEHHTLPCTEQ